jgi:hypothetical protein
MAALTALNDATPLRPARFIWPFRHMNASRNGARPHKSRIKICFPAAAAHSATRRFDRSNCWPTIHSRLGRVCRHGTTAGSPRRDRHEFQASGPCNCNRLTWRLPPGPAPLRWRGSGRASIYRDSLLPKVSFPFGDMAARGIIAGRRSTFCLSRCIAAASRASRSQRVSPQRPTIASSSALAYKRCSATYSSADFSDPSHLVRSTPQTG